MTTFNNGYNQINDRRSHAASFPRVRSKFHPRNFDDLALANLDNRLFHSVNRKFILLNQILATAPHNLNLAFFSNLS